MKHQRPLAITLVTMLLVAWGGGGATIGVTPPTVVNTAPVASAGTDQSVNADGVVTLDGSKSSDADGDALSYAWTLAGKPSGSAVALSNPSAPKPTFTPDVAGIYTASLIVNDGKLNSKNASSVSITAAAVNVAGSGQFIEAMPLKTITPAEIKSAMALASDSALLATPT